MHNPGIAPSRALLFVVLALPWMFIWSKAPLFGGPVGAALIFNILSFLLLIPRIRLSEVIARHKTTILLVCLFFGTWIPGSLGHITEEGTLRAIFCYLHFFACLGFMAALPRERRPPAQTALALGLCMAVFLLGTAEFFFRDEIGAVLSLFRTPESLSASDNAGKAASVFTHRNLFGCFGALGAVAAAVRMDRGELGGLPRGFWALFLCLALCGTLVSTSKNALIALGAGMACLFWEKATLRGRVLVAAVCILLGTFFFAAVFTGPEYGTNMSAEAARKAYEAESPTLSRVHFAMDKFSKGRLHIWKYWWNKKLHKRRYVWKGIGIGQFRHLHWDEKINAHSTYVQFLYEGGLLTLAAFLCLLAHGARKAREVKRLPLYTAFLCTMLFDHFFDYSLLWSVNLSWFLML